MDYVEINDEIDEQPAIYSLKDDGSIDTTEKRALQDLSDGEKALISLTFAVLLKSLPVLIPTYKTIKKPINHITPALKLTHLN